MDNKPTPHIWICEKEDGSLLATYENPNNFIRPSYKTVEMYIPAYALQEAKEEIFADLFNSTTNSAEQAFYIIAAKKYGVNFKFEGESDE